MKVIVTSEGRDMDSQLCPRFGRTEFFLLVDTDTMNFEVIENKQNINAMQGAGIQTAKTVINNKAEVLITGNCGPKAFNVLNAANIKIALADKGTVKKNVSKFLNNELEFAKEANVEGHWV